MKAREPILKRGRDVWDRVNMPPSEYSERLREVRARMSAAGVDAVVVYGRGDHDGDVHYVSNLMNKVPHWGRVVLITDGSISVISERSSRTRTVMERLTWIDDLQFCTDVAGHTADLLADRSAIETIGTVGFDVMPHGQRRTFEAGTEGVAIEPFDETFARLRQTKSTRERNQVARASGIVDRVFEYLEADDAGDVSERYLERTVDVIARLLGAKDVRSLIANPGPTEPHFRPAESFRVRESDPISLSVAVNYEGYWAAAIRTLRLDGQPPFLDRFDFASRVYEDHRSRFEPGRTTTDLVDAVTEALDGSAFHRPEQYDVGSGIGLDLQEVPVIDEARPGVLQESMALSPQLVLQTGTGAVVAFGDTVVIEEGTPTVLTR